MTPELRLLRALDELRDAMAAVLAVRREPDEPAELLTLTAAAARLGLSRSTVTRWADDGRLRTVGGSGGRRVPRAALIEVAQPSGPAVGADVWRKKAAPAIVSPGTATSEVQANARPTG